MLHSDVLTLLKPEISAVLSLISPLVAPITGFATGVAGTGVGNVKELTVAVSGVTGVTHGLLSPVSGALATL